MITRLFSIFEPSSSILAFPLNWTSTFIGILFLPIIYWASPSRWLVIWRQSMQTLHQELKSILSISHTGVTLFIISLFSLILFNNFLGLLPYIFTSSRHMAITLSLSLPIWLALIIFGWLKHTQHIFAHLVPQGTPRVLIPFMVLIESIRNLIRPATLAIRLAANITAGHLVLTLLSQSGPGISSSTLLSILILSQILLLTLESAVAIIQSYVFTVLRTLYTGEIN